MFADPQFSAPVSSFGKGKFRVSRTSVEAQRMTHGLRHAVRREQRLVGLVVKTSASRAEDPRFKSCWRQDFMGGRVIPVT